VLIDEANAALSRINAADAALHDAVKMVASQHFFVKLGHVEKALEEWEEGASPSVVAEIKEKLALAKRANVAQGLSDTAAKLSSKSEQAATAVRATSSSLRSSISGMTLSLFGLRASRRPPVRRYKSS
jgi:hypothetical protein